MEESILENKECGAASCDNQEQQKSEDEEYFCSALLRAIYGQWLAALRALGIGWDRDLLASVGKTAANLVFADAELRFHRGLTIIRVNRAELRKIFTGRRLPFDFVALTIERIGKVS